MKTVVSLYCLLLSVMLAPLNAVAQQSVLGDENAVRIAEARHLLSFLQDQDDWRWDPAPFAILLLTEDRDYLVGHPNPSGDFTSEGVDPILGTEVFSRPRTQAWSLQFLATFPAVGGLSTVVVGTAEATGRSSTAWVVTLLHEHFHQIQYGRPDYQENVAALELDGGDTSGMWMLNYPFPYGNDDVASLVSEAALALIPPDTSGAQVPGDARLSGDTHVSGEARISDRTRVSGRARLVSILRRLKASLSDADYRYLTFQFWQEGTARYMEHVVAEMAASGYEPTPAFATLEDFTTYEEYTVQLDAQLKSELASLEVASQKRFVMYPLGAAIGQMLERMDPNWMAGYFNPELSTMQLMSPDL